MTTTAPPRLLFVSHHFPPDISIGSKRSHRIASQMRARGWNVDVLCGELIYQDGIDERLMDRLDGVNIVRTHEFNPRAWARYVRDQLSGSPSAATPEKPRKDGAKATTPSTGAENPGSANGSFAASLRTWASFGLQNLIEIPDEWGGWLAPALAAAERMPRPDVVLATFPIATSVLVATAIATRYGVPLVLDYRDPWNAAKRRSHLPDARRQLEARIEAACHRRATALVTVTPGLAEEIGAQVGRHVHLVTNACEPERLAAIEPRAFDVPTIVYAGALYGGRSVTPILDSFARLQAAGKLSPKNLRMLVMGPDSGTVVGEAAARGVSEFCDVQPPQPHHVALSAMLGAAANILVVAPEHRLQVPAKVFEQMATGRPILCLAEATADARRILDANPRAFAAESDDAASVDAAVLDVVATTSDSSLSDGAAAIPAAYTVDATMGRLDRILRRAIGRPSGATGDVRLAATGDLMLPGEIVQRLQADPIATLGPAGQRLRAADIGLGNLETPLVINAKPVVNDNPLQPVFLAPASLAHKLREGGYNVLNLANNHIGDGQGEGIIESRAACIAAGIAAVGAGADLAQANRPAFFEIGERVVAVAGYSSFCTATPTTAGSAPMHEAAIVAQVQRLCRQADHVVVSLHDGIEYAELPAAGFRRLCHAIAAAGADVVLGHHPHVYQGHEFVDGCWIVYSLGNTLADTIDPTIKRLAFERTAVVLHGLHDLAPDDPRLEDVVVAELTLGDEAPLLDISLHRLREDLRIHASTADEQARFGEQLADQLEALRTDDARMDEFERLFLAESVGGVMNARAILGRIHRIRPRHAKLAGRFLVDKLQRMRGA